jgi:phosphate/sulfate permease
MGESAREPESVRPGLPVDAWIVFAAAIAVTIAALSVSRGPELWGILWIWVVQTVTGAVLSAPIVFFGRRRVHWGPLDLLAFLLPFAVWLLLVNSSLKSKSIANLVEPVFIGLAIPVGALLRLAAGDNFQQRKWSVLLAVLLCVTAACIYWWTPSLPE